MFIDIKKIFLVFVGSISFILGVLGVILPILPTTPFLLLASYCFARSSKRFDRLLRSTKIFQFYAEDYVNTGTIPRKKKWVILANIYLLMSISIYLAPINWVRLMLLGLLVFLTIMLFFIIPDAEEEGTEKRSLDKNNDTHDKN